MTIEAIILNREDNVATAVRQLKSGEVVNVAKDTGVTLLQDIPVGHKFALRSIESGDEIIKYGEVIGQATARIKAGEHVHIHNVEGLRGRGDKQ
jgi:altronate dehydratase small subunit